MIFCTYCGKSFTRKEHLERHIPKHTNVKPHRCSLCQLSFPRRDLLQRHHFTYHEDKEPMPTSSGTASLISGRTPIACANCASAKAGCDKRVPCSRCASKNLTCEARFARRSAKAAIRPSSSFNTFNLNGSLNNVGQYDGMASLETKDEGRMILPESSKDQERPGNSQKNFGFHLPGVPFAPDSFVATPNATTLGIDHSFYIDDNINGQVNYQELMAWTQYPIDHELPPDTCNNMQADMGMAAFMDLMESSSSSDAMASGCTSTSLSMCHTRATSATSQFEFAPQFKIMEGETPTDNEAMIPEIEDIIAAEAAWPLARCNIPIFSGACPRTAIVHLENLENNSKHDGTWKSLQSSIELPGLVDIDREQTSVLPLTSITRDRIHAITQSFFYTAVETHRGVLNGCLKTSSPSGGFNFLVLPPSNTLEHFLRNHLRHFAPYYCLVKGSMLDPNELLPNNQTSTLLLLLMIASGATVIPTAAARCLTAGLTETCRISLFHIIEKDVELSADIVVLRCALLFTILGAWSGDAWHMNIAMGQRGMYIAMLKHAGMLEPWQPLTKPLGGSSSTEMYWREWLQRESKSRLVYNFAMVDQELSLFHDTAPILLITELETPMPGSESLWLAKDANEWLAAFEQANNGTEYLLLHSLSGPPPTPSLCDLFHDMLHDKIDRRHNQLSPQQLKLLLHPLQSLLCHLRQVLSCFSDLLGSRRGTRTVTKVSTLLRLEEVQSLLQKWYELCDIHAKADPACPITRSNLVLYHLISLNAVTSFPEIERLARKEMYNSSVREFLLRYKRCIYQHEEALFHSGQVIRLVYSMPREGRPLWWPAAIYRASMIIWVESMARKNRNELKVEDGQLFPIDAATLDEPVVREYLWNGDGTPVLTGSNRHIMLHKPGEVLNHCVGLLDQGVAIRVSDGIKRKLQTLSERWRAEMLDQTPT